MVKNDWMSEHLRENSSIKGRASEYSLLAALLDRGYNASRVNLPYSAYDIVIDNSKSEFIRVQTKAVSEKGSIYLKHGLHDNVDWNHANSEKTNIESLSASDIVVGVESDHANGDREINFYFVPTLFIKEIKQKSITTKKVSMAKNRWDILSKCKDSDFVLHTFRQLLPEQTQMRFSI